MVMKRAMDEKRAHDESRRAQGLMQIAQRATREQEARFSQLADSIDEVFFVMDAQYRETLISIPHTSGYGDAAVRVSTTIRGHSWKRSRMTIA